MKGNHRTKSELEANRPPVTWLLNSKLIQSGTKHSKQRGNMNTVNWYQFYLGCTFIQTLLLMIKELSRTHFEGLLAIMASRGLRQLSNYLNNGSLKNVEMEIKIFKLLIKPVIYFFPLEAAFDSSLFTLTDPRQLVRLLIKLVCSPP